MLDLVRRQLRVANGRRHALARRAGLRRAAPAQAGFADRIVCTYRYHYADGSHAFDVVRLRDPKDFRQRAPDGRWTTKGIAMVLYRLPEMLEAPEGATVFFVEGEKDVDRLLGLGLRATTSPAGPASGATATPTDSRHVRVVAIPDNDEVGEEHAAAVVASFRRRDVPAAILRLPGLPPKGDVSDWLDAGGTREVPRRARRGRAAARGRTGPRQRRRRACGA